MGVSGIPLRRSMRRERESDAADNINSYLLVGACIQSDVGQALPDSGSQTRKPLRGSRRSSDRREPSRRVATELERTTIKEEATRMEYGIGTGCQKRRRRTSRSTACRLRKPRPHGMTRRRSQEKMPHSWSEDCFLRLDFASAANLLLVMHCYRDALGTFRMAVSRERRLKKRRFCMLNSEDWHRAESTEHFPSA